MRSIRIAAFLAIAAALAWFGYQALPDNRQIEREPNGEAISKIIWSKMQSTTSIKVADLSGDVQGTAEYEGTVFTTRQKARFPFSVDYFVNFKSMRKSDLYWDPEKRRLYIDAPDVVPAAPNIDESRRFAVETTGIFVSREAAEELVKRVSVDATSQAANGARTQKNMDGARERGVLALSKLFSLPLAAAGYDDVTVIVTFPPERTLRNSEQWDRTASINEALANGRQQR
ncbi:MAG: DUF4230 domain-containing protein [Pseudomonadota bacterium]|uniref:DUF4230 domain-containing protein n=1 Tax=Sphingobium TaxID=165695 RepID=UPI0011202569|nr:MULTISPECIES: DUF4230 domain-containing protein [Sphingobium]QWT15296.1 DUF4230 domain-containing protein [Sphingobium xenophagum]